MQKVTHDAPPSVRKDFPNARDNWLIMDASELPDFANTVAPAWRKDSDWSGGRFADHVRTSRTGDMTAVAQSEALLSEMASYMPQSQRRGYIMDVAGAVPCVPAFLSGNPMNMRRRIKVRDEYAPLAIVYDPTCSGGLEHHHIFKRGLTVLALVRALSGLRPIELYVVVGLGGPGGNYIAVRVETAPLDVARAAWMLTAPGMVRGLGYNILHDKLKSPGGWPYNNCSKDRGSLSPTVFRDIMQKALPHVSDVLAIPGLIVKDDLINDPRGWLARTFLELTGQQEAA
jgi:hypothetical protein